MKKVPTLFVRDVDNPKLVTREINPEAAWLLEEEDTALATVKRDGTNVRVSVVGGEAIVVEKRRNPSKKEKQRAEREGRPKPEPHYVGAYREDPADKHIFAAVDGTDFSGWPDGRWPCEALGKKIQGGVEGDEYRLYPFTLEPESLDIPPQFFLPVEFDAIRQYLEDNEIEGIVWHGSDGEMVKVKRRDVGLEWPVKERKAA